MALDLYDRIARLTVGRPGQKGVVISGLRIGFDIKKTIRSEVNTGDIQVWNLSPETREAIVGQVVEHQKSTSKKGGVKDKVRILSRGDAMVLEAGYAGTGMGTLCKQEIIKVEHEVQGTDVITKLSCGDGADEKQHSRSSRTFPRGTPKGFVFSELAKDMGLPTGNLKKDIAAMAGRIASEGLGAVLSKPFSVSGKTSDALDRLAESHNFHWSVQDGEVQMVHRDLPLLVEVFVITPKTGLIGSPTKTDSGCNFKCLLIHQIGRPGMPVIVKSREVTGAFRIDTVSFRGDTHAEEWVCEVETTAMPSVAFKLPPDA